jgi:hypothetical protein
MQHGCKSPGLHTNAMDTVLIGQRLLVTSRPCRATALNFRHVLLTSQFAAV